MAGLFVAPADAGDPEGCLTCHRYRGLARLEPDGQRLRLFYVNPDYHDRALGSHAGLRCTDCHRRDEVEVVPHHPVSPVDCTRLCHLSSPLKMEVRFGHDRIAGMLGDSVHGGDVLATSNRLLGSPLRPDQSTCLLCHDEPTFRQNGQSWAQQQAPISRCNVCHDERLLVNTRYYYWHVHARSRPARGKQDQVRVCALCHSDARVREHFGLPDTIASYLASFHGKAVLLGSHETADCLDCHVGPLENVHVMRAHGRTESPTHADRLGDTCRSPKCHGVSGERISTAAVHLELATSKGIETIIATLFVLMIVLTFGPSALLTALKMLGIVVGRHDAAHERHEQLARQVMLSPKGSRLLRRFTPHQRVQHWLLATTFVTLVLTGFPIKFADRPWAAWLVDLLGGLSTARVMHRWAGVLLISGMVYHLAYLTVVFVRRKRTSGAGWFRSFMDLPMLIRPNEVKQMGRLLGYLLFLRRKRPEFDRFNLEEKFEYFGVFWGAFVLGVTGVLMWADEWTSRALTGRVVTVSALVHTFEAFLALLHVGIVHMISVIFAPGVFPCSPAMFTGRTPTEELAEGHAVMVVDAARRVGLPVVEEEADHA